MGAKLVPKLYSLWSLLNENERLHSARVSLISRRIGEEMDLDSNTIKEIQISALMHDTGKIAISNDILTKKEKLTDMEFDEIKRHTVCGYNILVSAGVSSSISDCALYHHERWDGDGYPNHKKEYEIPFIARIVSVADAYEAMTAERTYKKAMSVEDAIIELKENSGKQFDPDIVKLFTERIL